MALIKCSECGKEISKRAKKACPQCGNPIPIKITTGEKIAAAAGGSIAAGAGTAAATAAASGIVGGTVGSAAFLALAGHGVILGAGSVLAITIGAPIAMFAGGATLAYGGVKLAKKLFGKQ